MIPKEEYNKILDSMPIPCVDLVIQHNGSFLLGKRSNEPMKDKYWFVGGRIRKGETFYECLTRLLKEEANITDIKSFRYIDTLETFFDIGPMGKPIHTINVTYHVLLNSQDKVKLDSSQFIDEPLWYRWYSFFPSDKEVPDYVKNLINKAVYTK